MFVSRLWREFYLKFWYGFYKITKNEFGAEEINFDRVIVFVENLNILINFISSALTSLWDTLQNLYQNSNRGEILRSKDCYYYFSVGLSKFYFLNFKKE